MNSTNHPNTRAWNQEEKARFITAFRPRIKAICARSLEGFGDPAISQEDLEQDAYLELMRVFDSYDPNSGASLETYAYKVVRRALISKFRKSCASKRVVAKHTVPFDNGKDVNGEEYKGAENIVITDITGANSEDLADLVHSREIFKHIMGVVNSVTNDTDYIHYVVFRDRTQSEIAEKKKRSQAMISQDISKIIIQIQVKLRDDPLIQDEIKGRRKLPRMAQTET